MNEGCNGICVRAYEILPGYGSEIAIPHPDCEVHGKPAAEVRSTDTIRCDYCGDDLPSVKSREHIPTTQNLQRLAEVRDILD